MLKSKQKKVGKAGKQKTGYDDTASNKFREAARMGKGFRNTENEKALKSQGYSPHSFSQSQMDTCTLVMQNR